MGLGSRLLFEDEHCLAIEKPAGQFTHGSWAPSGEQTLEQEVREYLNPANPSSVYLGIVHRLDRPVSGLLVWAKSAKSARRLSQQFEHRRVEKEYWAIVEDAQTMAQPERAGSGPIASSPVDCTWIDWLTSAGVAGVVRAVAAGTERARQAVTRFSLEKASSLPSGLLWLRLWPETGRTHQLRVQAALRGLPIVGDANYGASYPFPRGIALHARRLGLRHPILGTPLELSAPLPASWADQGFVLPDTHVTTGNPKNQAGELFDT
jgi:23S rRNA pseudouridine1911/1915/1917 synthase